MNLNEFVEKKLREDSSAKKTTDRQLQESELREALRQLEDDNII